MKKIMTLLIFTLLIVNLCIKVVSAKDTYFIVTAYYSPLPNQDYYLKGNYEAEKRLNWKWIRWASWKKVFSGMLAAPKNYNFWTKIYLEWLWIWEVADRGGAIVNAGKRWYNYDRIDVWMWYWDEWLRRALYWGKRRVKGTYVNYNSKITLNYHNIASPNWTTSWYKSTPSIFNIWIWIWSEKNIIIKLQKFLKDIWIYKWQLDWKYNKLLIDNIYQFQINNKLIRKWTLYWAWYWGTKTRKLILKKFQRWDFEKKITIKNSKKENNKLKIFKSPVRKESEIKELQNILIELNLYSWKKTWKYKDLIKSITKYQLNKKLISYNWEVWTWYFWPKTRLSLKKDYIIFIKDKEEKEKIRLEKERKIKEEKQKQEKLKELSIKEAHSKVSLIWTPKFWDISQEVRKLQNTLKQLGYFDHKDTAIFWKITKESLIKYQLDNKLISSKNELGSWIFWPKTKDNIKSDLTKIILNNKIKM